ncbi:unnamed protein product, partial [Mycena citricolor]
VEAGNSMLIRRFGSSLTIIICTDHRDDDHVGATTIGQA